MVPVPAYQLLVSWLVRVGYISRRDIPKKYHPTNHGTANRTDRPKTNSTKNRAVPTKTMKHDQPTTPTEPAEPCLMCGSPIAWRSAYGGRLMCAECEPWPARAMIGERWSVYLRRDGTAKWVPTPKTGEQAIDYDNVDETIEDQDYELDAYEMRDSAGEWFVVEKAR